MQHVRDRGTDDDNPLLYLLDDVRHRMLPDLVCLWVGKYDVCTINLASGLEVGRVKAGVIVVCLGESIHESPTLEQINIEQDLEPPLLV